jgi:hypothetical protein
MIGKGKSISHGVAALEYDLAKEIDGQAAATEIARHELYGCTGAEMVQEMKPYHIDFPNVKNNCLRFEVSPSIEESATFTDADWAELGNDFMQRMGLANHQYIIIAQRYGEQERTSPPAHTGKPGFPFRGTVPGQLDREKGNGSRQCHSQGTELCTVAGHRQSQQSGNQGSHGRRIEEDAGL